MIESVIKSTPRLNVKASRKFLETVRRDLEKPAGPVPTPKVDKAIEEIIGKLMKSLWPSRNFTLFILKLSKEARRHEMKTVNWDYWKINDVWMKLTWTTQYSGNSVTQTMSSELLKPYRQFREERGLVCRV